MTDVSAPSLFSQTYSEAREKFLAAANLCGAETIGYENPHHGAEGEQLYSDVALVGPRDASSILALCSGTHGVEGFCGSAVQTGLLFTDTVRQLPPDTALVLIHALNPYGFSHLRRVNEDNVDLNRNFVDHVQSWPVNPAYDALADVINAPAYPAWRREAAFLRLLVERALRGDKHLKVALTGGQYDHPDGLFYGGRSAVWSNQTLRGITERFLRRAEQIAFIDVHTGLGPFGLGELVCRLPEDSPMHARMTAWWGARVKAAAKSEAVAADLYGTVPSAVIEMLPESEVTATTLEFGTFGPIRVLRALQAENWHHQNSGSTSPDLHASKAALKQAFYPNNEKWETAVCQQGRAIVWEALEGLTGLALRSPPHGAPPPLDEGSRDQM